MTLWPLCALARSDSLSETDSPAVSGDESAWMPQAVYQEYVRKVTESAGSAHSYLFQKQLLVRRYRKHVNFGC